MVHAFATLGAVPQDLKYAGEPSRLVIGERCRIAEYAHVSGGTAAGGSSTTSMGDGCFIMSHCHIAHDCVLGNDVLLASSAALAGHVHVGDGARISGYSCVHQRVSIGEGSFVGGGSVLGHDLIPYGLALGNRAYLRSLNLTGLRRQRVPPTELRLMLSAFRYLFGLPAHGIYAPLALQSHATIRERAAQVRADVCDAPRLLQLVDFVLGRREIGSHSGAQTVNRALCLPSPHTAATSGVEQNALDTLPSTG